MIKNFFIGAIRQSPIDESNPAPPPILQSLIVESRRLPDEARNTRRLPMTHPTHLISNSLEFEGINPRP